MSLDDEPMLPSSSGEWDSDMNCYPHVCEVDGRIYLLYNGNQFGRHGFGLAVLEAALAVFEWLRSRVMIRASVQAERMLAGPALRVALSQPSLSRLERGEVMTEVDRASPDSFTDGVPKDKQELTAVDGILRPAVAGCDAARLRPDELAVLVVAAPLVRGHPGVRECLPEAHFVELAHGVGLEVDAGADRADLWNRFEDPAVNAGLMQAQRHRHSADAAAYDDGFHFIPLATCRQRAPGCFRAVHGAARLPRRLVHTPLSHPVLRQLLSRRNGVAV